jgi:AcrR family transcriptional regulator
MADQRGLDGLSVRALAEALGTRPMSLYRHVANKDDLVWLMVDVALGGVAMPEVHGLGWREGLSVAARQEWRAMRKHPWLSRALLISRPGAQPNALTFADRVMEALEGTRLRSHEKLMLHVLLHSFVQGMAVNVEAEANAVRESGYDEAAYMQRHAASFEPPTTAPYPHFARMLAGLESGFEVELDTLFEEGLTALLDGFAQRAAFRRRATKRANA